MDSSLITSFQTLMDKFRLFSPKTVLLTDNQNSKYYKEFRNEYKFSTGDIHTTFYKDTVLVITCDQCSSEIINFINKYYTNNIIILIVPMKFTFSTFANSITSNRINTIIDHTNTNHYIIVVNNKL